MDLHAWQIDPMGPFFVHTAETLFGWWTPFDLGRVEL